MIEYMVKRDGRIVPFDANKANHLMEWGEKYLNGRADIGGAMMEVIKEGPNTITASDFNLSLIQKLIDKRDWPNYMAAGRIYAFETRKQLYGKNMPTLYDLHQKMLNDQRIVNMGYTKTEYSILEQYINHDLDFHSPQFALAQMRNKYALKNAVNNTEYETPQFTYMRMAMALAQNEKGANRVHLVKRFYNALSKKQLSAPTPNYTNLGTKLKGYASCCLYACGDSNDSIRTAMLITNDMTNNSAGLGMNLEVRSAGDPVRNGSFAHRGKLPYIATFGKITLQNLKNGRDGAMTLYYQAFDPEATTIAQLRNPNSPSDKQNRDVHYAMQLNKFFVQKAGKNEEVFLFNKFTAPDLYEAMYQGDLELFKYLYSKYENDPAFKKTYVKARQILAYSYAEAYDTGTSYLCFTDEINRHTPFKDSLRQSNLCLEITLPTKPYESLEYLYKAEDHGKGEIGMCNLAALAVNNFDVDSDTEYFNNAYLALKMIDKTILQGEYPYPHLAYTSKQRMSAGVGMMGVATLMARKGLKYSSIEGKKYLHKLAERHMYFLIKASLAISKERGNAPWIHKTKWPEGWLPIDTYNRGIDEICDFEYTCDWEGLRKEIIENKGIAHSALVAYMPGESSSKALGTSNSIYPVRDLVLLKRDNGGAIDWAAEDGDLLKDKYELAFDIHRHDMIDVYGIFQKFTDQAISADMYRRFEPGAPTVSTKEIMLELAHMVKRGMKTRYYVNSRRPKVAKLDEFKTAIPTPEYEDTQISDNCVDGVCKL